MTPSEIITQRLQALTPDVITVRNDSHLHVGHAEAGNGVHLHLHIISARFAGLALLARHRLIYQTVGDLTAAGIHALAVAAFAPGETTKETP